MKNRYQEVRDETVRKIRAGRRRSLEKQLTALLRNYRIPQEHTDIIVALVRQATQ